MLYRFKHLDGTVSAVEAQHEAHGRHLAMVNRWGEPTGHYAAFGNMYMGLGLSLVSVEDSAVKPPAMPTKPTPVKVIPLPAVRKTKTKTKTKTKVKPAKRVKRRA